MPNPDINLIGLIKGQERYLFKCDDTPESRGVIIRTLSRFASNKDLSFSWYDAAVLCKRIRENDLQKMEGKVEGKAEVKVKPVNRIDPKN